MSKVNNWQLCLFSVQVHEPLDHLASICPSSESDDQNYRVCAVHALVHKLPDRNKEMLELLIKHLVTYVFQ